MKDHKMILRKSKKGEKIQLLDNSIINLPGGDIVIEDGSKKLVDLCGIMGGLNSSVTYETKKIILFIQTYNKQNIRKTSMQTGIRTIAATYFEKGLDEERVETGIGLGIELLEKYANAKISSKVIDIYPSIHKPIKILFSNKKVNKLIGIEISKDKQLKILNDLGFKIDNNPTYITVPFWRKNDIKEHNDLIEEVARIYGYFNLPSQLQSFTHVVGEKTIEDYFRISGKIKNILKSIGLNENINYSMVSEKLLNYFNLKKEEHLKIINPISKDMEFLRKSIIPSLVQNIKSNEVKKEDLRFFEISKVFNKRNSELPDEIYKLGIATNTSYYDLKGIMERILHELNIFKYELSTVNKSFFSEKQSACLKINNYPCIYLGRLKPEITQRFGILKNVYICEIDLLKLIENYKHLPRYKKPISYAVIKLDLTAKIKSYEEFKNQAFLLSKELINIKVKDIYKDNITLRFYFSNRAKNITEKEALEELDKIKKIIK